jgi:hypothetical protein
VNPGRAGTRRHIKLHGEVPVTVCRFGKAQRQDWSTTSVVVASTCWPKRS